MKKKESKRMKQNEEETKATKKKESKTQQKRKKGNTVGAEWTGNATTHDTCKQFKKKKTHAIIRGATNKLGSVMQKCPKNQ